MSASLSTFAYCVANGSHGCDHVDCCSQAMLEQAAEQIHQTRPTGTAGLANSLLRAWGMEGVAQATVATVMGKGIEILIPPCGRAIVAALSLSTEIATIQRDIDAPSTLSCVIRIDDRLFAVTSSQPLQRESASRMQTLKNILKQCAAGTPFGSMMWPASPGMTSGHWFANHFDIPYLDRRCYQQEIAAHNGTTESSSTLVDVLKEKCSPSTAATGALLLLDNVTMDGGLHALLLTGNPSAIPPVREWQMFEVKLVTPNTSSYSAGYFGEFVLDIPTKPQLSAPHHSMPQDYQERHEREMYWASKNKKAMDELKSASNMKGFLKAGMKFGKNKVGKFIEEQKRVGGF